MPYFHAFTLFEGRGSSLEETDQAAAALLMSVSHRRLRYCEHETVPGTAGLAGGPAYFTVFADFDVEAYTEEKAAELVDEVLDAVSTDDLQYFSHGLVAAVSPTEPQDVPADVPANDDVDQDRPPLAAPADDIGLEEIPVDAPPEEIPVEPEVVLNPPSRSSASMQVKTSVTLRASELELPANGDAAPSSDELIALATTEARRRHPDLPDDTAPDSRSPVAGGRNRRLPHCPGVRQC